MITIAKDKNQFKISIGEKILSWYSPSALPATAKKIITLITDPNTNTAIGVFSGPNSGLQINSLMAYSGNSMLMTKGTKKLNVTPLMYDGKYGGAQPFYWSASPDVYEIKIFDINFQTAPSFDTKIYGPIGTYNEQNSAGKTIQTHVVSESSYEISPLYSSPYKGKFAIVNHSDQVIPLYSSDGAYSKLMLSGNILVNAKDNFYTEQIDKYNTADELQINSKWIQDKATAIRIAKNIVSLIPSTSKTYALKIFGNPLIQIGDYTKLNYSIGNISSTYSPTFIVTSVSHKYDGTLSTDIEMKVVKNA
jgi:hypothetical protein